MNDSKVFWKSVKPFLSNKGGYGSNMQLVEDKELLKDDKTIAE